MSDEPHIEPGIAPLCAALNRVPEVRTIWSCEGHPSEGHRPYVVFSAPQPFAFALDRALCHESRFASGLRFIWKVTANFRDDGSLQWTIDPNDERFVTRGLLGISRWSRKQVDADVVVLARIVDALGEEMK